MDKLQSEVSLVNCKKDQLVLIIKSLILILMQHYFNL